MHCYSLYSFTVSSTNDVRVASGESAEAKEREGFTEGAKERELIVLLKQLNNEKSGRAEEGSETGLGMQFSQRNRERPDYSRCMR